MKTVDQEFIDADPIIREVHARGFRFSFHQPDDRPFLDFEVSIQGRPAGYAQFELIKGKRECLVKNVNIFPEAKRKRVGTALCLLAWVMSGYVPVDSSVKTPEGVLFWESFEKVKASRLATLGMLAANLSL